ncbi:hypothetical protein PMAC_000738 [Pneumocystis sp. 'macacae']|nr:hypothetical protein PMAC_000738 [Pneumocystis sp. 'macacae']
MQQQDRMIAICARSCIDETGGDNFNISGRAPAAEMFCALSGESIDVAVASKKSGTF